MLLLPPIGQIRAIADRTEHAQLEVVFLAKAYQLKMLKIIQY